MFPIETQTQMLQLFSISKPSGDLHIWESRQQFENTCCRRDLSPAIAELVWQSTVPHDGLGVGMDITTDRLATTDTKSMNADSRTWSSWRTCMLWSPDGLWTSVHHLCGNALATWLSTTLCMSIPISGPYSHMKWMLMSPHCIFAWICLGQIFLRDTA